MRTNFWCTRVQIFGRGGKNRYRKKERGIQKEKGDSLFLEKKKLMECLEYPHKLSIQMRCKLKYFLSREQNAIRRSVPAQKIRGLLESSLNVG
jgi:hypothetical protein